MLIAGSDVSSIPCLGEQSYISFLVGTQEAINSMPLSLNYFN
jgi:hypothetical protein